MPSMCLLARQRAPEEMHVYDPGSNENTQQLHYYVQEHLLKCVNGTREHAMNSAGDKAHLCSTHPRLVYDFLWHKQPVNASLIYQAP